MTLQQPNREYESKLVELVQVYPKYCAGVLGYLSPSDIQDTLVRELWRGVLSIGKDCEDYEASNIVSALLVSTGIAEQKHRYTSSLDDLTPETVAKKIQEMAYFRRVDDLNSQIANAVRAEDVDKVVLLKEQLAGERVNSEGGMKTAEQVHTEFEDRVNEGNISLPWLIAGMDKATGGKEKKTLIVIAARPGMGKSAFALQACRNDSYKHKAGFFQLEMGAVSMWARLACPAVGVDWKDVIGGTISEAKKAELIAASKKLAERYKDLYIDDTPGLTTSEIYRKTVQNNLEVIYIDHLWIVGDKGDSEVQRLGDITMRFKNMSKALDIPVILLVQLSRTVEKRANKTPVLSDMRDSGKIEETADNVLMLYRPSYYENNDDNSTEVWMRKFRNGEANVAVYMEFDQKKQWFDEPEKRETKDIAAHWMNDK